MTENFLEEQLKRIRDMSEQMSRVRNRAAELSQEFERDRAMMRHDLEIPREPHNQPQPHAGRHVRAATRRRRK
jgi:hypothetical protein